MAGVKNIIRGDNHDIEVTFYESDGVTPVNLTGGAVFFTVNADSEPTDNTDAVIAKKVTSHSDPTDGTTLIELSATDTNIAPGTYYYDIQFVDSNGRVLSKRASTLNIIGDISRATT